MCNVNVFGVNVVEVEKQVKNLIDVYKTSGKKATLKEWGYKLNGTYYGETALVAKFLKVLFEAENDEFITTVLAEKEPTALFGDRCVKPYFAEHPSKWNIRLMGYMKDLANDWAVYNLPILQEVMDATVEYMTKVPDYLDGCYAVEDMMDAIKEDSGLYGRPAFQTYVAPYIAEYLKGFYLDDIVFDDDETEEINWDYLEYVWRHFCDTELIETILLSHYDEFMEVAVREVLKAKGF